MKLEVGQFVRTKDGYISQYKYYDTTKLMLYKYPKKWYHIEKEGRIWNYYLDFIKKQIKKRIEL